MGGGLSVSHSASLWALGPSTTRPAPIRYALFEALTDLTGDPDTAPAKWLRDGAPLGVTQPIPAGGHFPIYAGPPPSPLEVLLNAPVARRNHPSFATPTAAGTHP